LVRSKSQWHGTKKLEKFLLSSMRDHQKDERTWYAFVS
jgi:hypothetical protein